MPGKGKKRKAPGRHKNKSTQAKKVAPSANFTSTSKDRTDDAATEEQAAQGGGRLESRADAAPAEYSDLTSIARQHKEFQALIKQTLVELDTYYPDWRSWLISEFHLARVPLECTPPVVNLLLSTTDQTGIELDEHSKVAFALNLTLRLITVGVSRTDYSDLVEATIYPLTTHGVTYHAQDGFENTYPTRRALLLNLMIKDGRQALRFYRPEVTDSKSLCEPISAKKLNFNLLYIAEDLALSFYHNKQSQPEAEPVNFFIDIMQRCCSLNSIDTFTELLNTQDELRMAFLAYVTWYGQLVDNADDYFDDNTNDAIKAKVLYAQQTGLDRLLAPLAPEDQASLMLFLYRQALKLDLLHSTKTLIIRAVARYIATAEHCDYRSDERMAAVDRFLNFIEVSRFAFGDTAKFLSQDDAAYRAPSASNWAAAKDQGPVFNLVGACDPNILREILPRITNKKDIDRVVGVILLFATNSTIPKLFAERLRVFCEQTNTAEAQRALLLYLSDKELTIAPYIARWTTRPAARVRDTVMALTDTLAEYLTIKQLAVILNSWCSIWQQLEMQHEYNHLIAQLVKSSVASVGFNSEFLAALKKRLDIYAVTCSLAEINHLSLESSQEVDWHKLPDYLLVNPALLNLHLANTSKAKSDFEPRTNKICSMAATDRRSLISGHLAGNLGVDSLADINPNDYWQSKTLATWVASLISHIQTAPQVCQTLTEDMLAILPDYSSSANKKLANLYQRLAQAQEHFRQTARAQAELLADEANKSSAQPGTTESKSKKKRRNKKSKKAKTPQQQLASTSSASSPAADKADTKSRATPAATPDEKPTESDTAAKLATTARAANKPELSPAPETKKNSPLNKFMQSISRRAKQLRRKEAATNKKLSKPSVDQGSSKTSLHKADSENSSGLETTTGIAARQDKAANSSDSNQDPACQEAKSEEGKMEEKPAAAGAGDSHPFAISVGSDNPPAMLQHASPTGSTADKSSLEALLASHIANLRELPSAIRGLDCRNLVLYAQLEHLSASAIMQADGLEHWLRTGDTALLTENYAQPLSIYEATQPEPEQATKVGQLTLQYCQQQARFVANLQDYYCVSNVHSLVDACSGLYPGFMPADEQQEHSYRLFTRARNFNALFKGTQDGNASIQIAINGSSLFYPELASDLDLVVALNCSESQEEICNKIDCWFSAHNRLYELKKLQSISNELISCNCIELETGLPIDITFHAKSYQQLLSAKSGDPGSSSLVSLASPMTNLTSSHTFLPPDVAKWLYCDLNYASHVSEGQYQRFSACHPEHSLCLSHQILSTNILANNPTKLAFILKQYLKLLSLAKEAPQLEHGDKLLPVLFDTEAKIEVDSDAWYTFTDTIRTMKRKYSGHYLDALMPLCRSSRHLTTADQDYIASIVYLEHQQLMPADGTTVGADFYPRQQQYAFIMNQDERAASPRQPTFDSSMYFPQ